MITLSARTVQIAAWLRSTVAAANQVRGGKPMRVTSASASRSSALRPA